MLNPQQFEGFCRRLEFPESGRGYLQRVRSEPPARRVSSRVGNVVCRFPSKKMGFVVSAESRGELATIYQLEHNPDVVEFYDQPESIKLVYAARSGRMTGAMHTPDFLVLRSSSVCWIEVKPEDRLLYLSQEQPNRYRRTVDGQWECPPGKHAASSFGFDYEVVNSAAVNRALIRNLEFLDDFYRDIKPTVPAECKRKVLNVVRDNPGITVAALRHQLGSEMMDTLFALIASGELYFDLEHQAIAEQETARLYATEEVAQAFRIVVGSGNSTESTVGQNAEFKHTSGQPELLSNGGNHPKGAPTPKPTTGEVDANNSAEASATGIEALQRAAPRDIALANKRYEMIANPELAKEQGVSARTLRRWRARFRQSEEIQGQGYMGLLPRYSRQGNHARRLPAQVYEIADEVIREVYMTPKRVSKLFAYGRFANRCQEAALKAPSYVWFLNSVRKVSAHDLKLAREGKRAAYPLLISNQPLSARNDNHGEFPWQVVHIDHTEVDVELVDEATGLVLGRPWFSLMFDAYSRRVLAFILTFDPPSTNSLKLLLRECVRRHRRLPSGLVLDWGKEFGSEFFETLTAMYQIRIINATVQRVSR